MTSTPSDIDNTDTLPLSKTKKKKQASDLQKLGEELSMLSIRELELLGLDPDLFKALVEAASITSNVAARRHRQYIGSLMRQVDPDPILERLEQIKTAPVGLYVSKSDADDPTAQACKDLLDKLMAWDTNAIESVLAKDPGTDRQHLRQLIRNANKEMSQKNKASKALPALKSIIERATVAPLP